MKPERIDPPAIRTIVVEFDEELVVAAEALGLDVASASTQKSDASA